MTNQATTNRFSSVHIVYSPYSKNPLGIKFKCDENTVAWLRRIFRVDRALVGPEKRKVNYTPPLDVMNIGHSKDLYISSDKEWVSECIQYMGEIEKGKDTFIAVFNTEGVFIHPSTKSQRKLVKSLLSDLKRKQILITYNEERDLHFLFLKRIPYDLKERMRKKDKACTKS